MWNITDKKWDETPLCDHPLVLPTWMVACIMMQMLPSQIIQSRCCLSIRDLLLTPQGHYSDMIMSGMVSQTTGVPIVYSIVCSGVDQRKHQSSASLAFVRGIHWWPVNSLHKGPVTWKMLPFDDVITRWCFWSWPINMGLDICNRKVACNYFLKV